MSRTRKPAITPEQAATRVRSADARDQQILNQPCPACQAMAGELCADGRHHPRRIALAKRAAAPGPCPQCGEALSVTGRRTTHTLSDVFDCAPQPSQEPVQPLTRTAQQVAWLDDELTRLYTRQGQAR